MATNGNLLSINSCSPMAIVENGTDPFENGKGIDHSIPKYFFNWRLTKKNSNVILALEDLLDQYSCAYLQYELRK